jgi:2-iminobutanoate/2-iminopropanoate deaminase
MKKEVVAAVNGPKAIGPYSPAIKSGNMLFISGQIPIDPKTGNIIEGGIEKQTVQVLENIKAQIIAGGCEMDHIVQTTIYMTNLGDFNKVNEIYAKYFNEPYPTRATIQISALPKGSLIEIAAIAIK